MNPLRGCQGQTVLYVMLRIEVFEESGCLESLSSFSDLTCLDFFRATIKQMIWRTTQTRFHLKVEESDGGQQSFIEDSAIAKKL